ncbi:uncharacterized protein [Cherax quadricarinatus]|uniref:uncharacterized protein isoform X2 n=1 Tax=Cherax quadricarinatus TaxID=27406 RepID=UPI00387EB480
MSDPATSSDHQRISATKMVMQRDFTDFEFSFLTSDDSEEIIKFLDEHLLPRCPSSKATGETSTNLLGEIYMRDVQSCLASGLSLAARHTTSKIIVGVSLNEIFSLEETHKATTMENASKMSRIIGKLYDNITHFEGVDAQGMLHLYILCTHQDYANHGLGSRLFQKTLELGKERGFQAMNVEAANSLTARIGDRFEFETLAMVDLTTLEEEFGINTSIIPEELQTTLGAETTIPAMATCSSSRSFQRKLCEGCYLY